MRDILQMSIKIVFRKLPNDQMNGFIGMIY